MVCCMRRLKRSRQTTQMCPTVTHQAVRGQTWSKIFFYYQSTHITANVVLDAVSGNVSLDKHICFIPDISQCTIIKRSYHGRTLISLLGAYKILPHEYSQCIAQITVGLFGASDVTSVLVVRSKNNNSCQPNVVCSCKLFKPSIDTESIQRYISCSGCAQRIVENL